MAGEGRVFGRPQRAAPTELNERFVDVCRGAPLCAPAPPAQRLYMAPRFGPPRGAAPTDMNEPLCRRDGFQTRPNPCPTDTNEPLRRARCPHRAVPPEHEWVWSPPTGCLGTGRTRNRKTPCILLVRGYRTFSLCDVFASQHFTFLDINCIIGKIIQKGEYLCQRM
jgi:hypothetical protein